jgi:putative intracellular protease/amidase
MLCRLNYLQHPQATWIISFNIYQEVSIMSCSTLSLPCTKRIGIFLIHNFEPLDVWGFCEAFAIARFLGSGYEAPIAVPFELVFIANQQSSDGPLQPVRSYNGPKAMPDLFSDQALDHNQHFDVIMVPGGYGVNQIFKDPQQLNDVSGWLRNMDNKLGDDGLMTSVCIGSALLANAGLLDGKAATSNHRAFAWVASQSSAVLWDNVARWVDAGRYVTSAGVSAGTDMAFYLVQRLAGRAIAEQAAIMAEYNWLRDPQQPIFYPQQAVVPVIPNS